MGRVYIGFDIHDTLVDRFSILNKEQRDVLISYMTDVFKINLNSLYYWLRKEGKLNNE